MSEVPAGLRFWRSSSVSYLPPVKHFLCQRQWDGWSNLVHLSQGFALMAARRYGRGPRNYGFYVDEAGYAMTGVIEGNIPCRGELR